MAGADDVVKAALKLIAGGAKEAGPSVAERAAKNIDVFNTANRLGVDTNDIAKLQETKRLMDYHKGFMGDVRERAQSLAELQRQMQEQGAFPMEVGTRFTTPHSQKFGHPPHIVTGYYVDPKNPSGRYGYRVRQEHADGTVTEQMLMIRDPKLEALHGPEKWEELQRGFVPMTGPKVVKASGGSIREGYGPGGWVDDVVKMAGKVIEGEGDNVTRLSDVKSARARDALIKQLKSSINQVKSGYFQAGRQALINQKSLDLHKSGMLPLQQGTIVTPPSTWDMPGDWRVSGYWYDEKDPRRFGYRLQNESGQTYDAAASDPRAGLRHDNPYSFGAGFKAYAGPNAAPPKPVASPVEKPAAAPKPPEVLDAINKEYEDLFGSEDPFKPRAHGGRIAKGPGGWLDDVVKMAGKVISGEGEDAAKAGIRAYQGSPHNFAAERLVRFPTGKEEYLVGQPDVLPDVPEGAEVLQDFPLGRMRMDKIGTGEGAQAYGHGLYLAEHEPVAQGYKDALRRKGDEITFDNMPLKEPRDYNAIQSQLENQEGDWRLFKAVDEITTRQGSMEDRLGDIRNWYRNQPEMLAAIDRAEKRMTLKENPGFVYETNISADPDAFLDWDKPLSEQPEAVRKLFPSVEEARLLDAQMEKLSVDVLANPNDKALQEAWDAAYRSPKHKMARIVLNEANPKLGGKFASGDRVYAAIAEKPSEASALLKGAGIPGIKFFDAGSRAAGEGTRNFVITDENLISIVRKYGIAGASAMLGYNLMEQLDPKQALAASMADQDYQASRPQRSTGGNNSISGALNVARGLHGAE